MRKKNKLHFNSILVMEWLNDVFFGCIESLTLQNYIFSKIEWQTFRLFTIQINSINETENWIELFCSHPECLIEFLAVAKDYRLNSKTRNSYHSHAHETISNIQEKVKHMSRAIIHKSNIFPVS